MKTSPLSLPLVACLVLVASASALAESRSGQYVSIEATQPVTTEPAPNIRVIPGEFTVRRHGNPAANEGLLPPLTVYLAYRGTAAPGVDYAALPQQVEFAEGQGSVTLQVLGIDDDELEPDETVTATIFDPTLGPIPLYEILPGQGSATVVIQDSDSQLGDPVVSIEATRRIAEESSFPYRRLPLVGEFTVSRTGPTDNSLPVWIHLSGSATPSEDYEPLPILVDIPSGERATSFLVRAVSDRIPEGIETVIATVSNCPPFGSLAPCYAFTVDPAKASDTVFIREDGRTTATVHVTFPANGAQFPPRDIILVEGVAIDLEGYINRAEFWDGDTLIGVSEIQFVRAPDPGTPILHTVPWHDPSPGTHTITMRATTADGTPLVSSPVRVTIGAEPGNDAPEVTIASPANGDEVPAGEPLNVVVEARDPDGYIPFVELFADGSKIGEMNIAFLVEPPPGQIQTFTFTWDHPMPGPHVLAARVTDNEGAVADSSPVEIRATRPDARSLVNVVAIDAFAAEPRPDGLVNTATFRIRRHGSLEGVLAVRYRLAGQARNGLDYEELDGTAVIPDGRRSVDVTVVPLADEERERRESVILTVEDDPAYRPEFPRRAIAVISDRPRPPSPAPPRCIQLADGLIHFCFPATPGACLRVESSSNLRDWTTLYCILAVDGEVHFVVERLPGFPHRYFRIAPEPNGLPER